MGGEGKGRRGEGEVAPPPFLKFLDPPLLFMHNYVYHRNKLPVVLSTYFEENKVIHKYNTRQKNHFHIDAIKTEIRKRSIKYMGSKLWNDLPAELKEIQSLQSFKYKLKNY